MGAIRVSRGGEGRLIVRLPFSAERVAKIRTLPGRRWHAAGGYWSVEDAPDMPAALLKLFAADELELEAGLAPSFEARILAAARARRLSPRTAATYAAWARRFLATAGSPDPERVGRFLESLSERSASTYNQALHALTFLFKEVLGRPLPRVVRAKMPVRVPGVLSREEVGLLLEKMGGQTKLMALLLYGSGLRLRECCGLRVKDIDWAGNTLRVWGRVTPMPGSVEGALRRHLAEVQRRHRQDLAEGFGSVAVPAELSGGYPDASREWGFQWVFPAPGRYFEPRSRQWRRHHINASVLQKAVREARLRSGIIKPASCQTLRQSFAAHMLEDGYDIRTVQELMGHRAVKSTLVYDRTAIEAVESPADRGGKLDRSSPEIMPHKCEFQLWQSTGFPSTIQKTGFSPSGFIIEPPN